VNKLGTYLAIALSMDAENNFFGYQKAGKCIPISEEMPTPEKYKNTRKVKNKMKKKRGY